MHILSLGGHVAVVALLCGLMSSQVKAGEVTAAVASNFAAPMERIVAQFQHDTGHTVKVSLGSSGKFYSQIKQGAPFDVFLAADEEMPQRLVQEGLAVGGTCFVYAEGKLVLWSAQPGLVDAQGAVLRKGGYTKLAIADPRLAPYGMAGKESLERLGLWNAIQGRVVTGENVTQTYQYAATGNADLGFVALSQVMRDGRVTEGSYWLVPSELYTPIRQSSVLLSGAKDKAAAQALLNYLKGEPAKVVIRSFGYGLP
ncbi:MAG TPA: molybdate ABC transporter substrate-binding protein [Gallionella sp.]|nr:molybdate ABC transporter substrate-binding protein [Gallionella sp.]